MCFKEADEPILGVWFQLRPDRLDGSTVDKESRFSAGQAAGLDRFRQQIQTDQVVNGQNGCRSGQNRLQTEELLGRENVAAAAVADFPSLVGCSTRQARPVT